MVRLRLERGKPNGKASLGERKRYASMLLGR